MTMQLPDYLAKYEYFIHLDEESLMDIVERNLFTIKKDKCCVRIPLNQKVKLYLEMAAASIALLENFKAAKTLINDDRYIDYRILLFGELATAFLSLANQIERHYPHLTEEK